MIVAFIIIPCKIVLAAETGQWALKRDPRENPSLEFIQNYRNVLFYVGVGRAYAIWLSYPDPDRADGDITVRLSNGKAEWELAGTITHKHAFGGNAAYFYQWDMGLPRPAYNDRGENYERVGDEFRRFFDFLINGERLIISTDVGEIELPRVNVPVSDAKEYFKCCVR
jgi:hypothetical protein